MFRIFFPYRIQVGEARSGCEDILGLKLQYFQRSAIWCRRRLLLMIAANDGIPGSLAGNDIAKMSSLPPWYF
jgi:hypothetical protein